MTPQTPPPPALSSPFGRLLVVERTGSTNTDMRRALTGADGTLDPDSITAWPHLSALHALTQTAGRGRADHTWTTPPTGALTASVVLRPRVPVDALAWLPLLAGLAVQQALAPQLNAAWQVRTKWPNDVVAVPTTTTPDVAAVPGWGRSRKLAGILTELVLPGVRAQERGAAGGDDGKSSCAGDGSSSASRLP
ncbi:biotin--[acetyl-CoA-carboxylase] ligase, partial [Actinomyces sp. MRS3W]|uniref:biotin--[acetyl-CoA-carboxylase] ligase n=1 Tax=Actinomyces sp. MRS3W TaxID=2800796 RepID=UPI0028FD9B4B|nr:hypothetical protein [Actinomyces sp. MRS3W]